MSAVSSRNRASILVGAALALLILAPLAPTLQNTAKAAENPPNILIIVTDDQPADPATYQMMPKTMRIVSDKGVHFTNAVATTPMCCPSRASIFSGKYTHNHGVRRMSDGGNLDHSETFQKTLQEAGYRTAIVGKYLNNWDGNPPYFDMWAISDPKKHYRSVRFNINGTSTVVKTYLTSFENEMGKKFLVNFEESDDQPWLLYVAPYAPHKPAVPDDKYLGHPIPPFEETPATRETDLRDKPPYVEEIAATVLRAKVLGLRARQLRSLLSVDDMIAALIRKLSAFDEARNTLIIVMSDNGYMWYQHQLDRKFFPYDESVRIPLFVRWPAQMLPGSDSRIVANIDIAPTLYDAAGVTPSYVVDGRSLLSAHRRDQILLEFWGYEGVPTWAALWAPDWEYIEYADGSFEYYRPSDPWQLDNVYGNTTIGDEPLTGPSLSLELSNARRCSGSSCP